MLWTTADVTTFGLFLLGEGDFPGEGSVDEGDGDGEEEGGGGVEEVRGAGGDGEEVGGQGGSTEYFPPKRLFFLMSS